MKFRDVTRTRYVDRTIDGVTHSVPQQYTEQTPVIPRNWDAIATRTAAGVVLALTAVAVTWSTTSIGALLGGGVGYAAAGIFDLAWLTVLLLEWLSRFHAARRVFPRWAGWVLVLIAAGAIAWHGALTGGAALAVIGAAVSVVSKVLWLAVFKHVDRTIAPDDAAWLAAEESRLAALEALSGARLRAAQAEERVTLRLLAAERVRADLDALTGSTDRSIPEPAMSAPITPLISANTPADATGAALADPDNDRDTFALDPVPPITAEQVEAAAVRSIADAVRTVLDGGVQADKATDVILALLPEMNRDSVRVAVNREQRRRATSGPYV